MPRPNMRVKNKAGVAEDKVKIKFDVPLLNSLLKYVRCEYVSQSSIWNLNRFMGFIDVDAYQYETAIYQRLRLIQTLIDGINKEGISNEDLLQNYIIEHYQDGLELYNQECPAKNMLNTTECELLSKAIVNRIQTIEIYRKKDKLIESLMKIEACSFNTSYEKMVEDVRNQMIELISATQIVNNDQGLLKEFAFSLQDAAYLIDKVVKKSKRPAAILQTGIRQLNAILAPGFQSGRLYTILGGSGKFKSGTLLNITDQIRKYNPQIPAYENGLRKCILFVTLENSIEETLERLYDMYSDVNDDMRDATTEEVWNTLREKGEFLFNNENGIDIFMKYAGNLEISTGDLYTYIKELREKGFAPICVVLDYIKRIDSVHPSNGDERVRMSFVAKELKTIAQFYEIPVITAMQLNRDGNSIIDAAMRESKQDVARFVGSSSIGNAWDIIEDSDWVCLINLEMQKSTNQLFLTFKRLKIRGKSHIDVNGTIDYFNHPFTNAKNIRLETDVDKDKSVSIISLATDLESIAEKEARFSEDDDRKRPTLEELKQNSRGRVLKDIASHIDVPSHIIDKAMSALKSTNEEEEVA